MPILSSSFIRKGDLASGLEWGTFCCTFALGEKNTKSGAWALVIRGKTRAGEGSGTPCKAENFIF